MEHLTNALGSVLDFINGFAINISEKFTGEDTGAALIMVMFYLIAFIVIIWLLQGVVRVAKDLFRTLFYMSKKKKAPIKPADNNTTNSNNENTQTTINAVPGFEKKKQTKDMNELSLIKSFGNKKYIDDLSHTFDKLNEFENCAVQSQHIINTIPVSPIINEDNSVLSEEEKEKIIKQIENKPLNELKDLLKEANKEEAKLDDAINSLGKDLLKAMKERDKLVQQELSAIDQHNNAVDALTALCDDLSKSKSNLLEKHSELFSFITSLGDKKAVLLDSIKEFKKEISSVSEKIENFDSLCDKEIKAFVYSFQQNEERLAGFKKNYTVLSESRNKTDEDIAALQQKQSKAATDKALHIEFTSALTAKINELEKLEKERLAREEAERIEKERLAREEAERLERERQEKLEAERLEKERLAKLEAERIEKERLAKLEAERLEKERLAKEEAERVERERQEKLEAERLEKERLAKEEAERLERERQAKLEAERIEKERLAKLEAERIEKERLAKLEAERLEKERLAREEAERLERERQEKLEAERLEKERLAKLEAERIEKERLAKLEAERIERERLAKLEAERLEKERLAREEAERLEKERLAKEEAERIKRENEEELKKQQHETKNVVAETKLDPDEELNEIKEQIKRQRQNSYSINYDDLSPEMLEKMALAEKKKRMAAEKAAKLNGKSIDKAESNLAESNEPEPKDKESNDVGNKSAEVENKDPIQDVTTTQDETRVEETPQIDHFAKLKQEWAEEEAHKRRWAEEKARREEEQQRRKKELAEKLSGNGSSENNE